MTGAQDTPRADPAREGQLGDGRPAQQQHWLRGELRRFRQEAGLTQCEAAGALEWSQSKILRIESGASRIRVTDLRAMVALYKVSDPSTVEALCSAARAGRTTEWPDKYRKHVDRQYYDFIRYEISARRIQVYAATTVPALLQTGAYTTALYSAYYDDPTTIDRMSTIVAERQQVITVSDKPPELEFVLDQSTLCREVGNPRIMRDQFAKIRQVSRRPNVTVRMVPLSAGLEHGVIGPSFHLLELDEGAMTVFVDDRYRYVARRDTPQDYATAFAAVTAKSKPLPASLDGFNDLVTTTRERSGR